MPSLWTDARHPAIGMIQAGTPQRDVALRFGVHRNNISSLYRRFQITGSRSYRPRSVRPRVTSQRQGQYTRVTLLRNRFQMASVTAWTIPGLRCIQPRSVRSRLCEHHIRPIDPACTRSCCHAIMLNVCGGHVPIWGGVWENGKLYCSQMNLNLV